ncbi:hypothetical protein FHR87_000079 [Azomonas macrocytogenes]|uniref:Iron-containing redox enzyme family protein n=1 Tax=Azomonas macrocytogenes TaxID=69962 RepID=A0A839SYE3_AZOMA|nr:hypothetical protein [Azomonas macrocytogenes]
MSITATPTRSAKALYFALLACKPAEQARNAAASYLDEQLKTAANSPCDLPDDPLQLATWSSQQAAQVGHRYQAYLESRQNGTARRYFHNKAHAQYFLKGVAPTKLVDGAWLYGLLAHWNDARFNTLVRTYLEELGEGLAEQNHVVLYRQLLANHVGEDWQALDDPYFVQGAIQLALAEHAEHYLPEVIGFNLGYEQMPLHLLITTYELAELGIDPRYFSLHITVDNAHNGHARRAVQAVYDAWPHLGDDDTFYRRIRNGYCLNQLGASTLSVIDEFDPRQEVIKLLQEKGALGHLMHVNRCRFAERTVNQWLANPADIPTFLAVLEQRGWIKRHQDPRQSHFWQLIEGERAPMFGVFNAHERQLIHDWIAGDWVSPASSTRPADTRCLPDRPSSSQPPLSGSDVDEEARLLHQQLAGLTDRQAYMNRLIPLLSPRCQDSAAGLLATRLFCQQFNRGSAHA